MQKYHEYEVDEVSLDVKDKQILEQLNLDARMSLTQVSRNTGIPIDTVRYRIQRMEDEEVFRYGVIINPLKMGYPIFNVLYLQLIHFGPEQQKSLQRHVKEHPHLVYSASTTGKYDFAVGIVAKNMNQFTAISNDFKTTFSQIIKDVDVLNIVEEYKYDYLVDLIDE